MKIFSKYRAAGLMAITLVVLWIAMAAVFQWALPAYNFATSHIIPAVFLGFLLVFALLSARWEQKLQAGTTTLPQVFNFFLMWKMSKMIIGVVLVFCCQTFGGWEFRIFLILFAVFYMVFMALETIALRGIERRYKLYAEEQK
jgi:hypothetical protein